MPGSIPQRPLGRTGRSLSILGFGGIMLWGARQDHADRLVADAVARGVNYFDIAPTYGDAEVQLGPALEPFRDKVFLACKTTQRQADRARAEFEASLVRLRTDHFDLYQLHALTDVAKDVDAAFAPGGVMEFLLEAQRQGRVRHIGFSAHSVGAAVAALERYPFDSILVPVNFGTHHAGFGPQILDAARARGAAVLAIKSLAHRKWAKDDPRKAQFPYCWYEPLTDARLAGLAMRFTLQQPGVVAMLPPGAEPLFRLTLDLLAEMGDPLTPLSAAEQAQLDAVAAAVEPIFRP